MKKAIYTVVALDCIYIILASLSTVFSTVPYLSLTLKYAAFVIPLLVFVFIWQSGRCERTSVRLFPKREGFLITLPMIAPTIALTMIISFLSTLLMGLMTGATPTVKYDFPDAFLLHALLPSVCEELIFRFIPLLLMVPHSRKSAIVISSLLFAFVHANPYQIPYALVAGLIYMAIDIATESVIPSVILHLCNNTVALLWSIVSAPIISAVLGGLGFASIIAIILMRKRYAEAFSYLKSKSDRVDMQ